MPANVVVAAVCHQYVIEVTKANGTAITISYLLIQHYWVINQAFYITLVIEGLYSEFMSISDIFKLLVSGRAGWLCNCKNDKWIHAIKFIQFSLSLFCLLNLSLFNHGLQLVQLIICQHASTDIKWLLGMDIAHIVIWRYHCLRCYLHSLLGGKLSLRRSEEGEAAA
jgi:hypothetical protein